MTKHALVGLVGLGMSACGGQQQPAPQSSYPTAAPAMLTSLRLSLAEGTSVCPGAVTPVQLVVAGTTRDGRQLATPTSFRQGQPWLEEHGLPWARFAVTASAGMVTPIDLYVPPPSMLDLVETSHVELRAQDLAQPGLVTSAQVPVDFKCGALLAMRGRNGGDGGTAGSPGASVEVRVGRLTSRVHGPLILARVDSYLGRFYYLLAPGGAPLTIDLRGGDGGAGGSGERTQLGYSGTNAYGDPVGASLDIQAPAGQGGAGGQGGAAVILVDKTDRLLASAIRIVNMGGNGGAPGENKRGTGSFEHVTGRGAEGPPGYAGPMTQVRYEDPKALFADEIALGYQLGWQSKTATR
jgi:hypothetical protein